MFVQTFIVIYDIHVLAIYYSIVYAGKNSRLLHDIHGVFGLGAISLSCIYLYDYYIEIRTTYNKGIFNLDLYSCLYEDDNNTRINHNLAVKVSNRACFRSVRQLSNRLRQFTSCVDHTNYYLEIGLSVLWYLQSYLSIIQKVSHSPMQVCDQSGRDKINSALITFKSKPSICFDGS